MTLKENFINTLHNWIEKDYDREHVAELLEIDSDDYAIEFAEWLYKWDNTRLTNRNWIIGLGLKVYTSEEVLVKFKKEKGL